MIEFCGYSMPLQYGLEGIVESCLHTRASASLFDTSHMGQLRLYGKDRASFLERLTVGDIKGMEAAEARLTLFTNDKGGIVDDSIVTVQENYIQLVVNAGCKEKDIKHIEDEIEKRDLDVTLEILNEYSLIALQGPQSMKILQPLISNIDLKQLLFMRGVITDIDGIPECTVTRCGYTGEDGFEISIPDQYAESLARRLLSTPSVKPAGLGARDSLRLEAGMCLYGHDISETTTPIEASLTWTIGKRRRSEGGFLGEKIIFDHIKNGVSRKRVGLTTEGAAAREGCEVLDVETDNSENVDIVGKVTSGSFSPTLKSPISMAYIKTSKSKIGTKLYTRVHKKLQSAEVVKMPFVPVSYYRGPDE